MISRATLLLIPLLINTVFSEFVRLPGNSAFPDLRLKTGYLNANQNATWKMFYFLLEARDVARDVAPLLIWFNGGPGCSSLGAFFEEFGPLFINYDGESLFENPHSWHHRANILFLESPIGVGFSYDRHVANYSRADDTTTAEQNFRAVTDFFEAKHPEYAGNDFYVAAESYGGVYGPMLSARIVEAIRRREFPNPNFQGLIIGNGFMNVKLTTNTQILWSAYHGRTSPDEWEAIKEKCKTDGARDVDQYDFTQFMTTKNKMDYMGDMRTECGRLIDPLIGNISAKWEGYDFFNFYHDCYRNFSINATNPIGRLSSKVLSALLAADSTDNLLGFACWADESLTRYLNLPRVKAALGIDEIWEKRHEKWAVCNEPMYDNYTMTFDDTTRFFSSIIENFTGPKFRILIYNGDVDTACNYLADQYFMRRIAQLHGFRKTIKHQPWYYSPNKVLAGYKHGYSGRNRLGSHVSIHVATVKGAGHFVPLDRPGPAHFMLNAFLNSTF